MNANPHRRTSGRGFEATRLSTGGEFFRVTPTAIDRLPVGGRRPRPRRIRAAHTTASSASSAARSFGAPLRRYVVREERVQEAGGEEEYVM